MVTKNIHQYPDIVRILNAAIDRGGVVWSHESAKRAHYHYCRINNYRALVRKLLAKDYPTGMVPSTPYDLLVVTHPEGSLDVTIKPRVVVGEVTDLDGNPIDLPHAAPDDPLKTAGDLSLDDVERLLATMDEKGEQNA